MNIEEKIREAANLHANKGVYVNTNDQQVGLRGYGESSFIAGANFASKEILSKVEEFLCGVDFEDDSWSIDDLINDLRNDLK